MRKNTTCFRIEKLETGYWVTDAFHTFRRSNMEQQAIMDEPRGAFTTLDEALAWIKDQMKPQPAPAAPG